MHQNDSDGAQRAKSSSTKLPKYLMVRGSTFYFYGRVPTGLAHAFPEARSDQVWKSLDTDLRPYGVLSVLMPKAGISHRMAAAMQIYLAAVLHRACLWRSCVHNSVSLDRVQLLLLTRLGGAQAQESGLGSWRAFVIGCTRQNSRLSCSMTPVQRGRP